LKYVDHYMLQISVTSPNHTYTITFTVTNTNCRIQAQSKLLQNSFTEKRKRHSSLPPQCSCSRNRYYLYIFTLQYCIGFAIHQHASTTGVHVFPILNPSQTHNNMYAWGQVSVNSRPWKLFLCVFYSSLF